MNAKLAKKVRKVAHKSHKDFALTFAKEVAVMGLPARLKLCWTLIRMPRKSNKEKAYVERIRC